MASIRVRSQAKVRALNRLYNQASVFSGPVPTLCTLNPIFLSFSASSIALPSNTKAGLLIF